MLKVTALALFAAFLGAEAAAAQSMTLTSPDIKPGARIGAATAVALSIVVPEKKSGLSEP